MSAPFAIPAGDPDAVRRAAARFGAISVDHHNQLTAFNRQAAKAVASWNGPVADQYASVATELARRFTAVVTALTAIQHALTAYARALEDAQDTMCSLNRHVLTLTGDKARVKAVHAGGRQESDALTSLSHAARTCAQTLRAAMTTLAANCPDTISAEQFVQSVRITELRLSNAPKGAL